MPVYVDVLNESGYSLSSEGVQGLVAAVLEPESAQGNVGVAFIPEPHMKDLNQYYLDLDEPTDVLSFAEKDMEPLDFIEYEQDNAPDEDPSLEPGESKEEEAAEWGEIVVCPSVVERYAQEEGNDPEWQMAWTLLHGTLHLLGYDHETDQGEMRKREQELLEQMSGLFAELCFQGSTG